MPRRSFLSNQITEVSMKSGLEGRNNLWNNVLAFFGAIWSQ